MNTSKYSQQDVAHKLEIAKIAYVNWEKESTCIKSQHFPKAAELLQIDTKNYLQMITKLLL